MRSTLSLATALVAAATFATTAAFAAGQGDNTGSSSLWEARPLDANASLTLPTSASADAPAFVIDEAGKRFIAGGREHAISEVRKCKDATKDIGDGVNMTCIQAGPEAIVTSYKESPTWATASPSERIVIINLHHGGDDLDYFFTKMVQIMMRGKAQINGAKSFTLLDQGFSVVGERSSGEKKDHRNHNSYNIDVLAAAIDSILKKEGASRLFIFGFDRGGNEAIQIVHRYPQLAKRIAVWGASLPPENLPLEGFSPNVKIALGTPSSDTIAPAHQAEWYADKIGASFHKIETSRGGGRFSLEKSGNLMVNVLQELGNSSFDSN